jgi:hypothetical protein
MRNIDKWIRIRSMIVDKLAEIKPNSLVVPKLFLLVNIEIKLATMSLGMCLNSLPIGFLCPTSVLRLLLMGYIGIQSFLHLLTQ